MSFDRPSFADKLQRYCKQLEVSVRMLAEETGISEERLEQLIDQRSDPTGDEVLILADYFRCDFKFFISNERLAPFEQTEKLFRAHSDQLSREDKWAIQEFLFLCECQEFLLTEAPNAPQRKSFRFKKSGAYYKAHGQEAAVALRRHLGYSQNAVPIDLFKDFRTIGIHIFRRQLQKSSISGLFIRHPTAGPCVLVNYGEDAFRQRFTVAHEAAHAILDDGEDFVLSFSKWDSHNLSEVRANAFASHYLVPPEFLRVIPKTDGWSEKKVIEWAEKLSVNTEPLVWALVDAGLVNRQDAEMLKRAKVPMQRKHDPELSASLSQRGRERKAILLQRGLSAFYASLCFDAYDSGFITAGRLAEMLLSSSQELPELASLYGKRLHYGD